MTEGSDTREAAEEILDRLARLLPSASPLAQAFVLILLERENLKLATLARMLDLPLALAVRAATELAELTDETGAALATFTQGRSPGAGALTLTPAGVWLARRATAPGEEQTDHRDH